MINQVTKVVQERVPSPLGEDSQICDRGSGVVKAWKHDSLAPHWNGPYTVVLTSPTAVKLQVWVHHMTVRRAYHADLEDAERTTQQAPTEPRETKIILKKKQRGSSAINCCYKDLLVSS